MQILPLIQVCFEDLIGKRQPIYDTKMHLKAALEWLKYAQDQSTDGGVASWYSLLKGWDSSFIETTGYILETFLHCWDYLQDEDLKVRAIRMADFIVDMQLENGGYRTYPPEKMSESDPTIFNTGQDLIGMTEIYRHTKNKRYLHSAIKAGDFLCSVQEKDGSWVKFEYGNKPRTYETRTSWALLKLYKLTKDTKYLKSADQNLQWALKKQLPNGWFQDAELPYYDNPITHTISYTIEGFLWSGILINNKDWISTATKAAYAIREYYLKHGYMPGSFNQDWLSDDRYTCLTGDAQLAFVWLVLYKRTKDGKYLKAALQLNNQLKTLQNIKTKNKNILGGIKGSHPSYGDVLARDGYCRLSYLNWATKFFADSLLEELQTKIKI